VFDGDYDFCGDPDPMSNGWQIQSDENDARTCKGGSPVQECYPGTEFWASTSTNVRMF